MSIAPPLPLTLIAQAVPKLSHGDLVALTERLIERLDEIDPDPDLEPETREDGDEDCCSAGDDGRHWKSGRRECGPVIDYRRALT